MKLTSFAQLVRLPNLPSAWADIFLGALAVGALPSRWLAFVCLLGATTCLYWAGMVFNDYFDLDKDKRERPDRPIPSGRVSVAEARSLGLVLFALAFVLAFLAGWRLSVHTGGAIDYRPLWVCAFLTGSILLYDGPLKESALGPVAMGLCRFLNVLLAVSLSGSFAWPTGPHLALVVGLYVVGVTWFGRTEASVSSRTHLQGAAGVMLVSLILALMLPTALDPGTSSPFFPYLLVGLGFFLGLPVVAAIRDPLPSNVQSAMGRCLMGLVLLDAVAATAVVGVVGLGIAFLLLPAMYLRRQRWLYVT